MVIIVSERGNVRNSCETANYQHVLLLNLFPSLLPPLLFLQGSQTSYRCEG